MTHAGNPDDLLTYCGLPVEWTTPTVWLWRDRPQHHVWHRIIDCPKCLDHQEVKARVVEQALR